MTNTLSIAVLHAISTLPSALPGSTKGLFHFPCNNEDDFNSLVDMCDYRLNDEEVAHKKAEKNKTDVTYSFLNGCKVHLFVKEG